MEQSDEKTEPVLLVVFYRTEAGNEPAREWLKSLKREDRKTIGEDIKTAQFGWRLGMPLIKKLEPGLWEVRSKKRRHLSRAIYGRGLHHGAVARLHQKVAEDTSLRLENSADTVGGPAQGVRP